jgi:NitT/TauT family transport system permease protein
MAVDAAELGTELAGLDALEQDISEKRSLAKRLWPRVWPKVAALALVIGLWQLVVLSGWKEEFVLPGPLAVGKELLDIVTTGKFWEAVVRTARRAGWGYGISLVIGVALGGVVAMFKPMRSAVGALITGLQTMPSIVWFPPAVLLFKLSESAIAFVVIMGAAPAIANGLISGVDHVPPILVRAGRVLGARGFALFRYVVLPAALPSFLGGLKQAWAFAWRSLMAAELLATSLGHSIGADLQFARDVSDAKAMYAMMIVLLVIGLGVDSAFGFADTRLRRRYGLIDTAATPK